MTTGNKNIPNGWTNTFIKDVAVVNRLTIDKNYKSTKIEYIDIASVENREIKQIQFLSLSKAPSRAKRIVCENDILISTVRPNLKHYCKITKSNHNSVASTGFAVITATNADPNFLYYLLTTDTYTDFLSKIADGHTTAYPSFNPDIIENSILPMPSLTEQRSIADVLSSLDSKIELLRKQNKTLEAIAHAIFKEWFVNFNFPDKEGKPYKDNGGKMIDSELSEIPEGWRVENLNECLSDIIDYRGKTPKKLGKNWSYRGIPALSANNIKDGRIVREDAIKFVDLELYKLWMKDELQHGDVLLTSEAPLGELFYLANDDKYVLSQRLFALRSNNKINSSYLYYWLKSFQGQFLLRRRATGSTVEGIRQSELREVEIIIPDKKTLKIVSNVFGSSLLKINNNNKQIQTLINLRDTLLPKLMNGQVRVKIGKS